MPKAVINFSDFDQNNQNGGTTWLQGDESQEMSSSLGYC